MDKFKYFTSECGTVKAIRNVQILHPSLAEVYFFYNEQSMLTVVGVGIDGRQQTKHGEEASRILQALNNSRFGCFPMEA